MAKKAAAAAAPPKTYASAMDKLRDEMAENAGSRYVQVVGEYLTDYLLDHPEAEAAILADGKSIKGSLSAMEALDIGPVKVSDALRISGGTDAPWHIRRALLPSKDFTNVCTRLARLPDKPRRKILRRILNDLRHADDWRDYYGQLARLRQVPTEGAAFTEADMALLLPKDMMAMHQRMTERERVIEREKQRQAAAVRDAALTALLDKRLRDAYTFRAAGLILRPYESTGEVVDEGAALHICIGSYAERYANGDTVICCLRRAEEPDEPWRAVEFSAKTGKVVQDRGAYNDARGGIPPGTRAQLRNFWNAWEKAHRKGRKSA